MCVRVSLLPNQNPNQNPFIVEPLSENPVYAHQNPCQNRGPHRNLFLELPSCLSLSLLFCTRFVYFDVNIRFFLQVRKVQSPPNFCCLILTCQSSLTHHHNRFGSMSDLNMAMCSVCELTGREMRTAIVICTIFLLFWNTLSTSMEHSKFTQHAEIRIFRIQGKTMSEAHRELV